MYSSVVEYLPSMYDVLSSGSSTICFNLHFIDEKIEPDVLIVFQAHLTNKWQD